MADLHCASCFEAWDLDTVAEVKREQDPEFEFLGSLITRCPGCDRGQQVPILAAMIMKMAAELYGDDLDGLAAFTEDFGIDIGEEW